MKSSIITYADIARHAPEWAGKRSVLVGGCFDVIHYGHVVFLQQAKEKGDILIVALESDDFIKKAKHRTPVHSQAERAFVLTAMKMIDYVILLPLFDDEAAYSDLVDNVHPSVIAVTAGDQALDKKKKQAARIGGDLLVVTPLLSTFSTTNILKNENFHSSRSTGGRNSPDTDTN